MGGNKKAQVEFFVLLGLLLLFAVVIYYACINSNVG